MGPNPIACTQPPAMVRFNLATVSSSTLSFFFLLLCYCLKGVLCLYFCGHGWFFFTFFFFFRSIYGKSPAEWVLHLQILHSQLVIGFFFCFCCQYYNVSLRIRFLLWWMRMCMVTVCYFTSKWQVVCNSTAGFQPDQYNKKKRKNVGVIYATIH